MAHWLTIGLLAQIGSQAFGGAPSLATRLIGFAETAPTPQTAEASLEQQQHNGVSSQWHIALASGTGLMHFDTHALARGATGPVGLGDHLHFDPSILLQLVLENTKLAQF
jgi:hypothetical protein